ncbi:VOC family protein [Candidatus Poriferisodalis sp.]|uniref:VOC family protein n=1 Tax=Candidatus Poriferisodalis sp. TaxID=3101277 RepID=UPI003D0FD1C3
MTATDSSTEAPPAPEVPKRTEPVAPRGVNHLVLNVRDIEESHHFWSNLLGFRQVGNLVAAPDGRQRPTMRFYSGTRDAEEGQHHHDIALMEQDDLAPPPEKWTLGSGGCAVNHIAITYPDRESWLSQVQYLMDNGVRIGRRTDHGMTHSIYITDPNGYGVEVLYDLPREVWENDINGALNYAVDRPRDEALNDDTDYLDDFTGWGDPDARF